MIAVDLGPTNFRAYRLSSSGETLHAIATATLQTWIAEVGSKTAYIEPGSPRENGYCESFNSKLRDEPLNREIFYSLAEARVLIEAWQIHDNTLRPRSSLGYRRPAP